MKKMLIYLLNLTAITNLSASPKMITPSKHSPKLAGLKSNPRQTCNNLALHFCAVGAAIATSAIPLAIYYFVKQHEQEKA